MDPVYLTELMGGIGEGGFNRVCRVTRYSTLLVCQSGYMALLAHCGVMCIWWLRVLAEVRVRDWRYCVVCMGDQAYWVVCVLYTAFVWGRIMGTEKWHGGGYIV